MADSEQRGRADEPYFSSGRGGAGNMRRTSASREARPLDGPDDFSQSRGREFEGLHTVTHSGRGGAGNVRTPSRDPKETYEALERERAIIDAHNKTDESPHSSGRGGYGNIEHERDRSRSRAREGATGPPSVSYTSAGRGGAGNIEHGSVPGRSLELERLEEEERRGAGGSEENIHSTGRGGGGNISHLHSPAGGHGTGLNPDAGLYSGRGGAGNIHPHPHDHDHPKHHDHQHRGEVVDEHNYRAGMRYE